MRDKVALPVSIALSIAKETSFKYSSISRLLVAIRFGKGTRERAAAICDFIVSSSAHLPKSWSSNAIFISASIDLIESISSS